MRTKFVASVIVVALWAVTAPAQNQVPNWEFDQQVNLTTIWNLWQAANFTGITIVEGAGLSGRYAMKVDCAGALDPMQFFRSYLKLEQGKKYYISFMAKAVAPRPISVGLEARALYNWVTYWQTDIQLTTEAQTFNFTYTHTGATVGGTGIFDSDIDLQFWLAGNGTDFYLDRVWMGTEPPPSLDKTRATDPVPVIGATDLAADPSLSWTPGAYAATHNVYLGTSFADVNTADATKPQLVSQGQTETTYKVSTPLEYGKTYYWRVDEVNAAPEHRGLQRQRVELHGRALYLSAHGVTATASSYDKTTTTPTNTVNGSGLTGDLHGISLDTMWTSSMTGPTPVWIQYQFDKAYKISELWVWNHNTEMETILGYGLKDVTIEYSLDGTTWTLLKDMQFAQAQAMAGYAHNTTVDFGGVMARYVKITAKSNWSLLGLKQYGLSEVRFFYIPVQARMPQPATAANGVSVDAALDWRPGRDAASQNVYLGTDKAAVTNGTAPVQTVTNHGFTPDALDFGTTYYWKVDEVGAATYPGDVWKFTTEEYAVVDNFESYDDKDNRIYDTWVDGLVNKTSSLVGYWQAPFAEQTLVHGGKPVHAVRVQQHQRALLLRDRSDVRHPAGSDRQRRQQPEPVLHGLSGGLRGQGQQRLLRRQHRHRHLGQRGPVPLCLQVAQRQRLDHGPRGQPDPQRRLVESGRHDPREPRRRVQARLDRGDSGQQLLAAVSHHHRRRQRQHGLDRRGRQGPLLGPRHPHGQCVQDGDLRGRQDVGRTGPRSDGLDGGQRLRRSVRDQPQRGRLQHRGVLERRHHRHGQLAEPLHRRDPAQQRRGAAVPEGRRQGRQDQDDRQPRSGRRQ